MYVYQIIKSSFLNKSFLFIPQVLAELLEANSTLKTVNAESNRLTGLTVSEIVRGTLKNQTLLELRLSNQVNIFYFSRCYLTKQTMILSDDLRKNLFSHLRIILL